MTDKKLGIYIHVPFCKSKCFYCDFYSLAGKNHEYRDAYPDRVCADLCAAAEKYGDREVDTVYFGGGTPTCLDVSFFEKTLGIIFSRFRTADGIEISTECNPGTVDSDYLRDLRKSGVNRLSIGVQSTDTHELKMLGRLHSFEDAKNTVLRAKNAGFDNISADLMYGIPDQTVDSFEKSVRGVCGLGIKHLSAYSLKLEENTPLFRRRGQLVFPDDEEQYDMYRMLERVLSEYAIKRYEISNFSAYGYESRHNIKYWKRGDYLGIGPAAHSFVDSRRFFNSSDIEKYFCGDICEGMEEISTHEAAQEHVMLGMRLEAGVDSAEFDKEFPEYGGFEATFGKALQKYVEHGLVLRAQSGENINYRFTTAGFFVSNSILSDVLDF